MAVWMRFAFGALVVLLLILGLACQQPQPQPVIVQVPSQGEGAGFAEALTQDSSTIRNVTAGVIGELMSEVTAMEGMAGGDVNINDPAYWVVRLKGDVHLDAVVVTLVGADMGARIDTTVENPGTID